MKLHKTGVAIVCVICLAKEYGPEAVQKIMRPLTDKKVEVTMRVLIIGEQEKKRTAQLVEYAAKPEHRLTVPMIQEMIARSRPPIGDDGFHVLRLERGFRCVFSIDQGKDGTRWYRHLSVSLRDENRRDGEGDRLPHPVAVEEIMRLFGYLHELKSEHCYVYPEEGVRAINVLEEYEEEDHGRK